MSEQLSTGRLTSQVPWSLPWCVGLAMLAAGQVGCGRRAAPAPAAPAAGERADRPSAAAPIAPQASAAASADLAPASPPEAASPTASAVQAAAAAHLARMAPSETGSVGVRADPAHTVVDEVRVARGGVERIVTPEMLIRHCRHAAANRDIEALKRYMTERLIASTTATLPTQGERFWRHMQGYVQAGAQGFALEEQPGPEPHSLQLVVRVGDVVLKPIVVRHTRGWLFDRF